MRLVRQLRPASPQRGATRVFTAALCVPLDHPVSRGHYPGHPIVPGILLVEAALQAIQAVHTADGLPLPQLQRLDAVQLLHAVQPGDALDLQLCEERAIDGASPRWRVGVACEGRPTARMQLVVGTAPAVCGPTDRFTQTDTWQAWACADIARRLPHRAPMLLVDGARIDPTGERLVASRSITLAELCFSELPGDVSFDEIRYPAPMLLESFAQAAGLLLGGERSPAAGATLLLGGMRQIDIFGSAHPGDVLHHEITLQRRLADAALVSGSSFAGRRPIARTRDLLIAQKRSPTSAPSLPSASGAHCHATS